jgi:hypothetical protein
VGGGGVTEFPHDFTFGPEFVTGNLVTERLFACLQGTCSME